MKNKYKFISILFIVFFLSLSFVSASDFDNETMSAENNDIISANPNSLTFKDLQQTINDAGEGAVIVLNESYTNDESNPYSLTIKNSLTLDGNGKTLDGNYVGTILYINADNVTLKNLNFINGKAANSGAISWAGNYGTINNCTFENNVATQYISGAIYWTGDYGTIIDSKFSANTAPSSGGAIRIDGNNFQIANNNFENNRAYNIGGGMLIIGNDNAITGNDFISNYANSSGGGFRIEGNRSIITGNYFYNNVAEVNLGGGMISLGNHTYIYNNAFSNNRAGRDGGAIDLEGYVFTEDYSIPGINNTVINNRFYLNKATYGGAISIYCKETQIIGNEFYENYASELGGALRWAGGDSAVSADIINNTFGSNSADVSGGAMFVAANKATISGNTFRSHVATNKNEQTGGSGGTITTHGSDTVIINNEFIDSTAARSGGAIYAEGKNAIISNNKFQNTIAPTTGGAIYMEGDYANIINNEFDKTEITKDNAGAIRLIGNNAKISENTIKNTKAKGSGGAMYIDGNSNTISKNTIDNATANDQSGGAITINGNNNKITENSFTNTKSNRIGGAIYSNGNDTIISKNTFDSNEVLNGNGGALYLIGNKASIDDNEFKNGKGKYGGAIYLSGSNAQITNNNFTKNTAATSGGAISIEGTSTIKNNEFIENTATSNLGGAISSNGDKSTMSDNSFKYNFAEKGGAAIYTKGSDVTATNNIFINNNGSNAVGGSLKWEGANAKITKNTFRGNTARTGTAMYGSGNSPTITENKLINSKSGDNSIRWDGENQNINNNIYETVDPTVKLTMNDVTITYGDSGKLTATLVDGSSKAISGVPITINLNNEDYASTSDSKGQVTLDLGGVDANTYTATATFTGNAEHDMASTTSTVKINKAATKTELNLVKELHTLEDIIITAKVNVTEGNVTFSIGTDSRTREVVDGTATLRIPMGFLAGEYTVTAQYNEGTNYLGSSASDKFTVLITPTSINTTDITINVGEKGEVVFTLLDYNNTPLEYWDIQIYSIYGNLNLSTDEEGKVYVVVENLDVGTCEIKAVFPGYDRLLLNSTATATVTVKSSIESEDLTADYGDVTYSAKFFDSQGNPLAKGEYVSFAIDNDAYRTQVGENGVATIDINKNAGNYTIIITNTVTGERKENKLKINPVATVTTLTGAQNVTAGTQVTLIAEVNATEGLVIFNVNGQNTTVNLTDGKATMNLTDLTKGNYTVTATYNDPNGNYITSSASASFEVTKTATVLTANDLTLYLGGEGILTITLTDSSSKALVRKDIKIIHSVIVDTQATDGNGQVNMTIFANAIDTYAIYAYYEGDDEYEPSNTTATVTVKSTIEADDLTADYNNATFTARFVDVNGVPLPKDTPVVFTIGDDTYNVNVDSNGVATLTIDKDHGEYTITSVNTVTQETEDNNITINQVATETILSGISDIEIGNNLTAVASVNATEGSVIFSINGAETVVNLTRGEATLELNDLEEGPYTVTATYVDEKENYLTSNASTSFKVTKKIAVLTADNVTAYFASDNNFTVTLTDSKSKGIAGKEITIYTDFGNITNTTDENGQIILPIYATVVGAFEVNITFEGDDEYEAANTTATITILNTIEADNVTADYNNTIFTARFLDSEGNPLPKGTNVSFLIENDYYTVNVTENGIATLTIDKNHGTYTITSGNPITGETKENTITISQVETEIILSGIKDIYVGDNLTIVASVNTTEGIVVFNVNGQESAVNLTRGEATLELNDLSEGPYTVTATYKDADDNYLTSSANATFKVSKKETVLTAENITIYFAGSKNLTVTLIDSESKGIARKEIKICTAFENITNTTDENGQIILPINSYTVGVFEVNMTFEGDDEYKPSNTTITITAKTTIESDNLTADYNNATFTARFLDTEGNPLAKGTNVSFYIENYEYPTNIGENGIATLTIDKNHGTYTVLIINDVTSEYTKNTITINQVATETTLTGAKDVNVKDNLTFIAEVNATEGSVIFNINGDETTVNLTEGKATLEYAVPKEGTYTVTVTYKDANENYLESSANATFEATKKATVLTAENVTMYYGAIKNLTITLTDSKSKGIAGKEINFTTSSGNATDFTDEKGQITKEVYGFEVGIFEVFLSFAGDDEYEASNTTITVTILTTLEAEDVIADYNNATFTARFLDTEGNPRAKGTNVSFFIENEVFTALVGDDGVATAVIDVDHGTYTIRSYNRASGQIVKNNITINQVATETKLDGIADLNAGDNLTITARVNATEGAVTFKVNEEEFTVNLTDGKATLDLIRIPEGSYTVTTTYKDAKDNYLESSANATFKVTKKDNAITVETNNITEDEDAVFNVTATAPNGKVTLTINNKTYTENLTDGKATFTVSNLTAGDYPFKVTFEDDFYYASNSTEGIINVKSDNLVISAPDLTKYFGSPDRFLVTVTDKDGNPLENIAIQIVLNGKAYNRTTNASGIAGMNINLGSGNYTAEVIYAGDAEHKSVNVTSKITVLATVFGDDVTKIQKGPEPYYATFLDSKGNYLPDGTTVQFNINGVLYDRKVSGNLGVARLNLNLEAGTYVITAMNPITGENAANNITIKPRLVNNSDVTKFYRNGTQYYVTVLGDDGKPIGADVTVKFNINGVFYERKTNASGVARLNLNLEPGKYIITAEYNGCRVSNDITVLPVLSAKDIDMRYKDGTKFKATLVNGTGAPYPGETVTFNINGVFYDRVTDKDGIAALNINLMPGKYIITSSYNGANIANTVTIKP